MINLAYSPYILRFKFDAGTSRGVLREKLTYMVKVYDDSCPEICGYGEAAYFKGLSPEDEKEIIASFKTAKGILNNVPQDTPELPSCVRFGLEQAIRDLKGGGKGIYFHSPFISGGSEIIINGLVWMGNYERMLERAIEKAEGGFRCIKFKIGAVNWEDELALLKYVRKNYGNDIQIRVDANGAFSFDECMKKLEQLSEYSVHSIEQPIARGHWEEMAEICRNSPLPIALDEELIGITGDSMKQLLERIKPHYIVLKPALCGGLENTLQWINLAREYKTGWWITSSLESNVGLDALSQFVGSLGVGNTVQGLGTGNLYVNNFPSPLTLKDENLYFQGPADIFRDELKTLDWIEVE